MEFSLETTLWLPLPVEEVFPFFASAGNLERITPPELRFRITTPEPIEMRPGALIDYQLALYGIPFRWRTRITRWEPPHRFCDEQLRGPYAKWYHTHTFAAETQEAIPGTRIHDHVAYRLPLGWLGLPAHPFVKRQLHRIFSYRQQAVREALQHPLTPGSPPDEVRFQKNMVSASKVVTTPATTP